MIPEANLIFSVEENRNASLWKTHILYTYSDLFNKLLTNFMAYGTRRFNVGFTWAL